MMSENLAGIRIVHSAVYQERKPELKKATRVPKSLSWNITIRFIFVVLMYFNVSLEFILKIKFSSSKCSKRFMGKFPFDCILKDTHIY